MKKMPGIELMMDSHLHDHVERKPKLAFIWEDDVGSSDLDEGFLKYETMQTNQDCENDCFEFVKNLHLSEKAYICSYCGETCHGTAALLVHERIHIHEKVYKCSQCGRTYSRLSDLFTHQKSHAGENPHQCPSQCGKCSSMKPLLATHQRPHPAGKPSSSGIRKKSAAIKEVSRRKAGRSELKESAPRRYRTRAWMKKLSNAQISADGAREHKALAGDASQLPPFGKGRKPADSSGGAADEAFSLADQYLPVEEPEPSSDDDSPSSPCRSIGSSVNSLQKDDHMVQTLENHAGIDGGTLPILQPEHAQGQEGFSAEHNIFLFKKQDKSKKRYSNKEKRKLFNNAEYDTPSVSRTDNDNERVAGDSGMLNSNTGDADCSNPPPSSTWPDPAPRLQSAHESGPLSFHTNFHQEKEAESMQTPQIFVRNTAREICAPASQLPFRFGKGRKPADSSGGAADKAFSLADQYLPVEEPEPSSDDSPPSSPCRSIGSSLDSLQKDDHVVQTLENHAGIDVGTLPILQPEHAQGQEGFHAEHDTPSVSRTDNDKDPVAGEMRNSNTGDADCSNPPPSLTWPDPAPRLQSAHGSAPLSFHTNFHQEKEAESMQTPQTFIRNTASEICAPAEGCSAVSGIFMRQRKNASYVWKFFHRAPNDRFELVCQECQARVRLGKENGCGKVGTSAMRKHMEVHHSNLIPQQRCVTDFATAGAAGKGTVEGSSADQMYHSPGGQSSSSASLMCHQVTMEESFCLKAPFGASSHQAAHYTCGVAMYIAEAMLPFSTVEERSFIELCAMFAPRWKVPSGQFFATKAIPALAEDIKAAVCRSMRGAVGQIVHFTSGMWTSNQDTSYLCVTAHWVGCNAVGALEHWDAALVLEPLTQRPIAKSLASRLRSVVEEWLSPLDLKLGSVTTNNGGSDYMKVFQNADFCHIQCIAHCLNLVVTASLQLAPACVTEVVDLACKIVSHFHHSSSAQEALRMIQVRRGLPQHRHHQEVCTQWNSTLHMLQRLCEQKEAINEYLQEKDYSDLHVRPDQWILMHNISDLLYAFDECMGLLSHSDATLGTVLPVIHVITADVEEKIESFTSGSVTSLSSVAFGNVVLEQLTKTKQLCAMSVSVTYHAATFLDPRFRDKIRIYLGEREEENYNAMLAYILEQTTLYCRERAANMRCAGTVSGEEISSQDRLLFERALQNSQSSVFSRGVLKLGLCGPTPRVVRQRAFLEQEPEVSARQELEAYIGDDIPVEFLLPDSNPLHYWEAKCGIWPCLSSVAISTLARPPTSVSSERLFSISGSSITKLWARLSPTTISTLSFVRSNRKWIPSEHCPPECTGDDYALSQRANATVVEYSADEGEDVASIILEPFVPDESSCELEEDM